jgi:2-dehydro-3-deoxygluconokinase
VIDSTVRGDDLIRVLAIGECMIELTHRDERTLSLSCAGDTFNTALYLARLTRPDEVGVDYMTLLGDDYYSDCLLESMCAEGIGTARVGRLPGEQPGLYLVRTDAAGERSFVYYRSRSAARQLFRQQVPDLGDYDVVYLSAITLQILTPDARERLFKALRGVRDGGRSVVFDSNYRPAGWAGVDVAREAVRAAWELTSVALPTFADERALFGDASAEHTALRLRACGIEEIVVKDDARGCVVCAGAQPHRIPAEAVEHVVDSTAAGDAFNAGYLAARFATATIDDAARRAHSLAAQVIRHPGAIVDESVLPRRPR